MESDRTEHANQADRTAEIDGLIADLVRRDHSVRTRAIHHLVSLGHVASTALVHALDSDDVEVRWQAALALRRIADPVTSPALIEALEDEDIGVRWLAAEALSAIGPTVLAPLLERLIHNADSVLFREGARHVLLGHSDGRLGPILQPVLQALEHQAAETSAPVAAYHALKDLRKRGSGTHSPSVGPS